MVKLTIVPVIPLAFSEAMKTVTFANSSSVERRRLWDFTPALGSWPALAVVGGAVVDTEIRSGSTSSVSRGLALTVRSWASLERARKPIR